MKISAYLAHLTKPNVTELVLTSGQRPMAVVGGEPFPFGNEDLTEDGLMSALFALGGSRYLDTLATKPAQWTARAEPVGTVSISAKRSGPDLEVKLSLLRTAKRPTDDDASISSPRDIPTVPKSAVAPPPPTRAVIPRDVDSEPKVSSRSDPRSSEKTASAQDPIVPKKRDPRFESDSPPPRSTLVVEPKREAAPEPKSAFAADKREWPPEPRVEPKLAPRYGDREVAKPVEARIEGRTSEAKSEPRAFEAKSEPRAFEAKSEPRAFEAKSEPHFEPRQESTLRSVGGPPRPPELERLLRAAVDCRASDLHLVAGRAPLFRVAFELAPKGDPLSESLLETMVLAIVPARLRLVLETDGSADFALDDPSSGRFRVNVSKQRTGYKVSLRVVPRAVPTVASLGLPPAIAAATHHHQGLVVVTGPTGHGKTTTLAALVDILNSERAHHVITVEDPIEYVHPRKKAIMSQREVGTDTQSFVSALKGSLREDPDVIVVGELRDVETVRMAVAASETGHLVLGTMNTPNAAKAIERLIDLFPPGDQPQIRMTLAGGLRMVIGQRLVPSVDKKSLHAAVELLPGSTSLWALIRDNRTFQIPSLQQRGKGLGITRLDESLAELVKAGKVSLDVAKSVAEAPQELEALLGAKPDAEAQKKPEGFLGGLFGKKG